MEASPTRNGTSRQVVNTAIDAERQLIGAALVDPVACAQLIEYTRTEHFFEPKHRALFDAIRDLFTDGKPVDPITISQDQKVDPYLVADLIAGLVTTTNQKYHSLIVAEKWMLRQAETHLQRRLNEIRSGDADALALLESVQHDLASIAVGHYRETHVSEAVRLAREREAEWRRGEITDYFGSGIWSLDRKMGGYPVAELIYLAGQSGAGKTSFLLQSCTNAARRIKGSSKERGQILLMSTEMTAEQIALRAACQIAEVNLDVIRKRPSDYALKKFRNALDLFESLPIHIDDTPDPSLEYIIARGQQIAASGGLSMIAVDYDERIVGPGETEERRVANVAKGLKSIAKRFEVPVVSISQYTTDGNMGAPKNHWLRFSRTKEHEAAVILHWYWLGFFAKETPANQMPGAYNSARHGDGHIVIGKNRFNAFGKVALEFSPDLTKFIDHHDPEFQRTSRAVSDPDQKPIAYSGSDGDGDLPF